MMGTKTNKAEECKFGPYTAPNYGMHLNLINLT
jgi:hypothetical protein